MAIYRINTPRGPSRPRGLVIAMVCLSVAAPVSAEEAASSDEIVVTATKRSEPLSKVPMSISVVTSDDIRSTGARDFGDFAKLVSGLSYVDQGPGNKRYALRGLQSAGEPEVALYYDEIPMAGLPGNSLDTGDSQPDVLLWDVDRIEVLKGPQGTLYGNGAMGGTIRILSKRPDLGRVAAAGELGVAVTDGGGPSWHAEAMLNLPVVRDVLAVRITGYAAHAGGWIDQIPRTDIALPQLDGRNINSERLGGGRASVLLKLGDAWSLTGIAYYQHLRTGGSSEVYPTFATPDDEYVSQSYVRKPWNDRLGMYDLIVDGDLEWAKVVVTGSYQDRTLHRTIDTTRYLLSNFGCDEFTWHHGCGGPAIVPAASYSFEFERGLSAEARLTSSGSGPFDWTVGAFAQHVRTGRDGQVAKVDADGDVRFSNDGTAVGRLFARTNRDGFDQQAVFGEVSYRLLPHLKATAGARWFRSDRSDEQTIVQQFFPGQPTGPEPFQRFVESKVFKRAELSYDLPSKGVVYVQAAQGFRAGGPNYPGGFDLTAPPYGADSVWDYEVGGRVELAGVWLSGAVFDMEWNHVQQLVPQPLFSYIANAGSARSRGLEAGVSVEAVRRVNLSADLTYNDARLVGPQPLSSDPAQQLEGGDRLANVPRWSAHASGTYEVPLGGTRVASLRTDVTYQSGRTSTVNEGSPTFQRLPGFILIDAHAQLGGIAGWRFSLDVTNLFNRYAILSGKPLDGNLIDTVTAARPRTIGVAAGFAF